MSVLTTAQNILQGIGLPIPSSIVANQNQDARRVLQCINDAGRFLATFEWNVLVAEVTISASSSSDTYSVPADFRAMVPLTQWRQGNSRPVAGPVRWVQWQDVKYGIGATGIADRFHLRYQNNAQRILITPVPGSAEQFIYLYFRRGWVWTGVLPYVTAVVADGNSFAFDDYLVELEAKWRMLRAIGQSYGEEKNEATEMRQKMLAEDGGMEAIDGAATELPWIVAPDRNYQL